MIGRHHKLHALLGAEHQLLPARRDALGGGAHLLAAVVLLLHHALRLARHLQRRLVSRLRVNTVNKILKYSQG